MQLLKSRVRAAFGLTTDIYSLGIVMYEERSYYHVPFVGGATISALLWRKLLSRKSTNVDTRGNRCCLHGWPDRYQSADRLARALRFSLLAAPLFQQHRSEPHRIVTYLSQLPDLIAVALTATPTITRGGDWSLEPRRLAKATMSLTRRENKRHKAQHYSRRVLGALVVWLSCRLCYGCSAAPAQQYLVPQLLVRQKTNQASLNTSVTTS